MSAWIALLCFKLFKPFFRDYGTVSIIGIASILLYTERKLNILLTIGEP